MSKNIDKKENFLWKKEMKNIKKITRKNGLFSKRKRQEIKIFKNAQKLLKEKTNYLKKHWNCKEHQWRQINTSTQYSNKKVLTSNWKKNNLVI